MLGIAIHCLQHSQAMLERGVCELAHSFFHYARYQRVPENVTIVCFTENMKQLPSFSQIDLVTRYGYTEKIRYTYYLKQGRPAFALLSFLSEEIDLVPQEVCPQR